MINGQFLLRQKLYSGIIKFLLISFCIFVFSFLLNNRDKYKKYDEPLPIRDKYKKT